MLWIKALHIIAMVTWFAGLFYLPRLFVYHAMAEDALSQTRFCVMERKLLWGIMTPGAIVTIACGLYLTTQYGWQGFVAAHWLHAKLALVLLTILYHVACVQLTWAFARGQNKHSHVWYRVFNEVPVLFLCGIVVFVVVRPL